MRKRAAIAQRRLQEGWRMSDCPSGTKILRQQARVLLGRLCDGRKLLHAAKGNLERREKSQCQSRIRGLCASCSCLQRAVLLPETQIGAVENPASSG